MKCILRILLITISLLNITAFADSNGEFPASRCERATVISPGFQLSAEDKARYFANDVYCGQVKHDGVFVNVYCPGTKTCCPKAPTAESYGCCGSGPGANCCDPTHCCPNGSHCTMVGGFHMCQTD